MENYPKHLLLPKEIYLTIFGFAGFTDFVNFICTCKFTNKILFNSIIKMIWMIYPKLKIPKDVFEYKQKFLNLKGNTFVVSENIDNNSFKVYINCKMLVCQVFDEDFIINHKFAIYNYLISKFKFKTAGSYGAYKISLVNNDVSVIINELFNLSILTGNTFDFSAIN